MLWKSGGGSNESEAAVARGLQWLKRNSTGWRRLALVASLAALAREPGDERLLDRMALATPRGAKERLLRRILLLGLERTRK